MKKIFFTVGPTKVYPTFLTRLKLILEKDIFSISHRSEYFHQIFENTCFSLRKLLEIPEDYPIFFLSSATEAMEKLIENLIYQKSYHLINGAFSSLFFKIAERKGLIPEKYEVPFGESFDFDQIIIPKDAEAICLTQCETSSGVIIPVEKITLLRRRHPDKLILVDIVSSVPYVNLDFKNVDGVFFSVQKGFGLPSGLGVLIISPLAYEKHLWLKKKKKISSYLDFELFFKYYQKKEAPTTPNVFLIYFLGLVAKDMVKKGIRKIREEIEKKSAHLYQLSGIVKKNRLMPFVKEKKHQSKTVIVFESAFAQELKKFLEEKSIVISSGYKEMKDKHIRIANYPAHTLGEIKFLAKHIREFFD